MYKFLALLVVSTALTGCLGGQKGPDEMSVVDSVPLTLPPSFELRPPRQGQTAVIRAANAKAEKLILGTEASKQEVQKVNNSWLVEQAGGETRNQSIREIMAEEAAAKPEEEKKGFFGKMFSEDENAEPTLEEIVELQKKEKSAQ